MRGSLAMTSLDTNILVYAVNEDAPEHPKAQAILGEMLADPDQWLLADQVLFEFYKALRNPRILENPLDARAAAERLSFLCEESGVARCCHQLEQWDDVLSALGKPETPYQRTHDIILAATLRASGVTRFHARNRKDFQDAGFDELINPIDGWE